MTHCANESCITRPGSSIRKNAVVVDVLLTLTLCKKKQEELDISPKVKILNRLLIIQALSQVGRKELRWK